MNPQTLMKRAVRNRKQTSGVEERVGAANAASFRERLERSMAAQEGRARVYASGTEPARTHDLESRFSRWASALHEQGARVASAVTEAVGKAPSAARTAAGAVVLVAGMASAPAMADEGDTASWSDLAQASSSETAESLQVRTWSGGTMDVNLINDAHSDEAKAFLGVSDEDMEGRWILDRNANLLDQAQRQREAATEQAPDAPMTALFVMSGDKDDALIVAPPTTDTDLENLIDEGLTENLLERGWDAETIDTFSRAHELGHAVDGQWVEKTAGHHSPDAFQALGLDSGQAAHASESLYHTFLKEVAADALAVTLMASSTEEARKMATDLAGARAASNETREDLDAEGRMTHATSDALHAMVDRGVFDALGDKRSAAAVIGAKTDGVAEVTEAIQEHLENGIRSNAPGYAVSPEAFAEKYREAAEKDSLLNDAPVLSWFSPSP